MVDEPMISEFADPLKHLIGNEYELGWRSVWIHTPHEAVRVEYRNSLVLTIVRKEIEDDDNLGTSIEVRPEVSEEG